MKLAILISSLIAGALAAEYFECPLDESTGKFADPDDCDKYWDCFRGKATPTYCDDGLAFNPGKVSQAEPCDYFPQVDCSTRPGLGEPVGTGVCHRRNGVYPHENENICDKYYICKDDRSELQLCPPGLHFNVESRVCDWAWAANRGACSAKQKLEGGFECDPTKEFFTIDGQKIVHPRFAHDDCGKFYVCKNGVAPAVSGCDKGLVFNDVTKECDDIANVPECDPAYEEAGDSFPSNEAI